MTKGYRTTEFWLSLAAILLGAVMASGALDDLASDHWLVRVFGIAASVLGALGYTAARGFVKAKASAGAALVEASRANPPQPPQG